MTSKDVDGNEVNTSTQSTGIVESIMFKEGYPQLILKDGRTVMLSQVMNVLAGEMPSAATPNTDAIGLELHSATAEVLDRPLVILYKLLELFVLDSARRDLPLGKPTKADLIVRVDTQKITPLLTA